MMYQIRSFLTYPLILTLAIIIDVTISTDIRAEPFSGTCQNGAQVEQESFCAFFKHYNNNPQTVLDTRIADTLGVKTADETRSIALIISISKYPLLDGNISAAAVDGERLSDFLINDQKFDEVIVLHDEEATIENISYFLDEYLLNRGGEFMIEGQPKARLLIAYSGHGTSSSPTTYPSFVLSAADRFTNATHTYKMTNFSDEVKKLAGQYFHVLTLINACYGGNFFTNASPGGNPSAPEYPGSYSITAGSAKDETRSLNKNRGSLFFDLLIEGVTKGIADNSYWDFNQVDEGGNATTLGITRTEPLSTFLTTAYDFLNKSLSRTDKDFVKLSKPWIGSAQNGVAEGAFFFVSKKGVEKPLAVIDPYIHPILASNESSNKVESFGIQNTQNVDILVQNEETTAVIPSHNWGSIATKRVEKVASDVGDYVNKTNPVDIAEKSVNKDIANSKTSKPNITITGLPKTSSLAEPSLQPIPITMLPPGPISSIRGKPEIKIFKPPHVYPVQGFDFSSADGYINWEKMNESSRPRFIYTRAVSWNGLDKTFSSRWSKAKALGIDRGAYMKFDFCRSPEEQLSSFSKIAPLEPDALPFAIEIVNPMGENQRQLKCLNSIGMEKSKEAILKLASGIRTHYGKTPLLYGNRNNLSTFLDQRSDEFMIWLGSYGASGIKLSGRNPWTLWQYSGALNIKGVGSKTTGEVFFGTEEQYQLFKKGISNVALDAVI